MSSGVVAAGDPWNVCTGISAGDGCGREGFPSFYTNVTQASCFIDWAAKCHFGESNINLGFKCNWGQKKLCKLEKALADFEAQVSHAA